MSMLDEVIKIEINTSDLFKPYTADYCVLVDASVEEVIECAEKHPKAFIFTFDTTPTDKIISEMIDYSPLEPKINQYIDEDGDVINEVVEGTLKPWMERLIKCLYIGNFPKDQHETIIGNWVRAMIKENQNLIYKT